MENLNPTLSCILSIQLDLKNNKSLKQAIKNYLSQHQDELSEVIMNWMIAKEQGQNTSKIINKIKSPYRRSLVQVLELGLNGAPIFESLEDLLSETQIAFEQELELFYKRLPVLCLFPLLFFQFPAFLMLFLGPLLASILRGF